MTDPITVPIRTEGQPAFPVGTGDTPPATPPVENKEPEVTPPAGGGDPNQPPKKDDLPFDQHPAWQERERKWDERFNTQETRHAEDMRKLQESITKVSEARKDNAENTQIPAWFGGTQEQWDAYRVDMDKQLQAAEERAFKRFSDQTGAQDKLVQEATEYMQGEIKAIEADKVLNPTNAKIDPNKLLKFVLDNDLVDSKGRWNYRAGFQIMGAQAVAQKPAGDRKDIAGATTSEPKPESKPAAFKTSDDFKVNRPW